MFAQACELGREGIVSKRAGSRYKRPEPKLAKVPEPQVSTPMRDHAHTLSDFRVPTLSIECERRSRRSRRSRYSVAGLMEQYGDEKLPDLRHVLANCPKAHAHSIHDRCRVRYGKDSRFD